MGHRSDRIPASYDLKGTWLDVYSTFGPVVLASYNHDDRFPMLELRG